jgi:hypothetical protein
MGIGLGIIRKALFIMTGGLSGLVFKEDSVKARTARPAEKPAQAKATQAKATRAKPQKARRAKAKATRKSTAASPSGTAKEIERLAKLSGEGLLTDAEFAAAKAKILGTSPAPDSPATYPAVEANVAAARHLADLAGNERSAPVASYGND